MGMDTPKLKMWECEQWITAQIKYHHGLCESLWHRMFYNTKDRNSREFPDRSSATLVLCNKCNGIRQTFISFVIGTYEK